MERRERGRAEIICTGSELLGGKLNLYVPLFHERLAPLGFSIKREQSAGDSLEEIRDCVSGALRRSDLVLVCGGLGPTFDDLTRQAAAAALGRGLFHSAACGRVLSLNYGLRELPPDFRNQCLLVDGAKALENANGTAFGEVLTRGRRMLALLPGPRAEWEPMFSGRLEAEIRSFFSLPPLRQVKLRTAGLGETEAEALLKPAMRAYPGLSFTILAGPGTVDFVISGNDGKGAVAKAEAACRLALRGSLYGSGDETLSSAAGKALREAGRTAACAESCTGGLAAKLLTDVPGSSDWFLGGVTAYSNGAKTKLLGVRAGTLKEHGAVSAACAREMAEGARRAFGSDYAFSVTGIAGPGGGTPRKPVGLVYLGLSSPAETRVFKRLFRGGRAGVRERAANFILDALRKIVK